MYSLCCLGISIGVAITITPTVIVPSADVSTVLFMLLFCIYCGAEPQSKIAKTKEKNDS